MINLKKLLEYNKCKLIGKYKNSRTAFTIENDIGYKANIMLQTLKNGSIKNTKIFFNKKNPYVLDNMNIYCKNNRPDFIVLSLNTDKRFNNRLAVNVKHKCGKVLAIRWANFTSKSRPTQCKCNGNYIWTPQEFENFINKYHKNIKILNTLDGPAYLTDIKCKCKICGNEWTTKANCLLRKKNYHCLECLRLSKFNPNLTEEDRRTKRDYAEAKNWKKKVYKKDNYICQHCNKKNKSIVAHHLNGWNWDIENRFNIDNGITLCEKCHNEFHNIYGYGNNTKEQFDEWNNKLHNECDKCKTTRNKRRYKPDYVLEVEEEETDGTITEEEKDDNE